MRIADTNTPIGPFLAAACLASSIFFLSSFCFCLKATSSCGEGRQNIHHQPCPYIMQQTYSDVIYPHILSLQSTVVAGMISAAMLLRKDSHFLSKTETDRELHQH